MHVSIVRELVYVLTVNLQVLSSDRIARPAVRAAGLRRRYATRAERIEEAILAFGGMRCEGGGGSRVFLLEVVPLSPSALLLPQHLGCLLVCWCSALQDTRCGGATSTRRRKCRRCRRGTRARRGVGRWMCTRPIPRLTCARFSFLDNVHSRWGPSRSKTAASGPAIDKTPARCLCARESRSGAHMCRGCRPALLSQTPLNTHCLHLQGSRRPACPRRYTAPTQPAQVCSYRASCDAPAPASWPPCPRHDPSRQHAAS
jgi:hypothetical protein